MKRWLVIVILAGLAACRMTGAGSAPTPVSPTPSPTPEQWSHVEAEGVQLSLRTPAGWQTIANDYGILLAQHADLSNAGTENEMLVYIFVPAMDKLALRPPDGGNLAWEVLNHVIKMPALVGNSVISPAIPVVIGHREGAYYLLSDDSGNRVLVLAVRVSSQNKLIVCNISTSDAHIDQIRDVLPLVFANLSVNGEPLEPLPLDWLPDPLVFPTYVDDDAG